MRTSYEEDLLTMVALTQLAEQFGESDSDLADQAWWLAVGIGEQYGVAPDNVRALLENAITASG